MGVMKKLPLGVYEKAISNNLPWEKKLLVAKEAGFDCLELSIDGTKERLGCLYHKSAELDIRDAMNKTGVPIYTMALTANRVYPLGSEDDQVRKMGLELVNRAIELAEKLNIRVIHLAAYDEIGNKSNEHTKQLFRESIEWCVKQIEPCTVNLALETMDTPFMGSCTNIVNLCKEIGSDKLKCYADIGNLTALGLDPAGELPVAEKWLAGIHLKDAKPGICRDVPFGEGIVDFDKSIQTLRKIGYNKCLIAEMWSYDQESFHPYLKVANSFLRKKLRDNDGE